MATSTVLRVKRRLEDNPQDALVLMCKRMKTDTDEISPSLFVFRGTVENQETPKVKNIVPKSDLKQPTSKVEDIIKKLRNERKEQSAESRYEVVNCSRGLKDSETEEFHLVDLQKKGEEEGVQYAYDLYMAATHDFDVSMLDNLVRIENYESDLVSNRNRTGSSSEEADDDDDSNDENNWRNEYPDSEASSIDEDDIVQAMKRVDIEDDLSTDDGEDQIFSEPLNLSTDDVKRYGEAYAKYKARVQGEETEINNTSNFVHCASIKEMDEESVDGYKEDSESEGFYYGQEEDTDQFREQYASDDEHSPD